MHTTDKQSIAISVKGVDVHYGAVQALFGVSLDVRAGETLSILGGNAAGKSTIVRSILGLVRLTAGNIHIHGKMTPPQRPDYVIGQGVASVPEGRRVFAEMTVRDNLLLGAYLRRKEKSEINEDVDEIYETFPRLKERSNAFAGTLSGGEQQMLALARAWIRRPSIVCIDEPSMGLSPRFVDEVYGVLARWKASGMTILLVEQNANIALELADRACVLQHGRVVLEGLTSDLRQDEAIKKAYLGTL